MMPRTIVVLTPKQEAELDACLESYRTSKATDPWKGFRQSDCGALALRRLHEKYGTRCIYCDHGHGRTIDHAVAKSEKRDGTFEWSNWRPACGDCNNLKAKKTIVDPMNEEPRRFLEFDLTTGEPLSVSTKRDKAKGEATRKLIDNQTFNEARRAALGRLVEALESWLAPKQTKAERARLERKLRKLFDLSTPHRAIYRDLLLQKDDALNPHRALALRALKLAPDLATWARNP